MFYRLKFQANPFKTSWASKFQRCGDDQRCFVVQVLNPFKMNFKRSDVYNIRIRLPFCDKMVPKNALVKLLKYEKIIDKLNSITSIPDLGKFIVKFIEKIKSIKPGVYNVVNPYPVTTKEMKFKMLEIFAPGKTPVIIQEEELYKKTAARRSNCVLSDDKIAKLGLRLPDTADSLDYCIDKLRNEIKPT